MFGFSGMVMAYDKPNGKFYYFDDDTFKEAESDVNKRDDIYAISKDFANTANQAKVGDNI